MAPNDELVGIGRAATSRLGGKLRFNSLGNVPGIELDTVVGQQIELPFEQTGDEAAPPIAAAPDAGELANPPETIEVDFVATVPISHPNGRNSRYDIIVVDPAVMADMGVANVPPAADARGAERMQLLGIGADR